VGPEVQLATAARPSIVVNTWSGPFENAAKAGYEVLAAGGSALDAVEVGCTVCEVEQCDTTVGYGNHPDTRGRTSLDALIMDGTTMDAGCVGYLRKYRNAISIARSVMHYTSETMLVGEGAEEFARMMGFTEKSATTDSTIQEYEAWVQASCQPNFYKNIPEAEQKCGPYNVIDRSIGASVTDQFHPWASRENHDTIGMVSLEGQSGKMACGTSTNGANHKIAGRVGDSPIPGSGCFVNSEVGGAAATGDGDVMMRFSPSFAAVSFMELGYSPRESCEKALKPISAAFPDFSGGVVCLSKNGTVGGATYNMD
ncbi:unnamed protein product, partial [Ectocarpus fasciculatus]